MARDIEEFLRRAAERRRKAQQGGGQKPQRSPAKPRPATPPPRQTLSERDVVQQRPSRPLPSSEPVQATFADESVNDHVKRHLDVSEIVQHVDQLGDVIEQADERMEAHLEDIFEHKVGQLKKRESDTITDDVPANVKAPNELANSIVDMLRNPKTIQQSILIAEILKPPTFLDEE